MKPANKQTDNDKAPNSKHYCLNAYGRQTQLGKTTQAESFNPQSCDSDAAQGFTDSGSEILTRTFGHGVVSRLQNKGCRYDITYTPQLTRLQQPYRARPCRDLSNLSHGSRG